MLQKRYARSFIRCTFLMKTKESRWMDSLCTVWRITMETGNVSYILEGKKKNHPILTHPMLTWVNEQIGKWEHTCRISWTVAATWNIRKYHSSQTGHQLCFITTSSTVMLLTPPPTARTGAVYLLLDFFFFFWFLYFPKIPLTRRWKRGCRLKRRPLMDLRCVCVRNFSSAVTSFLATPVGNLRVIPIGPA